MERLDRIRELFINLRSAHDWALSHADNPKYLPLYDKLLEKVERVYDELEMLGVDKTFSAALFIFGAVMTKELVEQWE